MLINGKFAAERHDFTKSSTGAFLTEETIEPSLIQAIVNIRTRQAIYWNDWGLSTGMTMECEASRFRFSTG